MRFLFSKNKTATIVADMTALADSKLHCNVYTLSETGPVRSHNEDNIAFSFLTNDRQNLIAVLADGMGGHNAGEVASKMACNLITGYITQYWKTEQHEKLLQDSFQTAHRKILNAGNNNPAQKGMGTTATVVLVANENLYFAHIGDSRLYQYHDGKLTQFSNDHTLVNEMYEKGEITKAERDNHPMKNVLLQALGSTEVVTPQVSPKGIMLQKSDKYLLCSDGVYDVCNEAELNALIQMDDPSFALECLRCIAIERKVSDNFSVIMISFSDEPLSVAPITKEQNVLL